jgi:DNA-directed RNA polymerase specialized sigma24 family protein
LRREIDAAVIALVTRHGARILATARSYAATPEGAEDAYQRGLEILLTKAPSASEDELVRWLKTVVTSSSTRRSRCADNASATRRSRTMAIWGTDRGGNVC